MKEQFKYYYKGPVKCFGQVLNNEWSGETIAPSEEKARNNLTYQYKKAFGWSGTAKIELTGEIKKEGWLEKWL